MDADMIQLEPGVGVESLIDELSRNPGVEEVHVREETHWTWTRVNVDPDDEGVRYGRSCVLSIVGPFTEGQEVEVARVLLDRHVINHIALNRSKPFGLVEVVAKALGIR